MDKVTLSQKLAQIQGHYDPHIVGELNGQHVKLVKFKGPFPWHNHEAEDEMFLVFKGRFRMEFREKPADADTAGEQKEVWLEEGEFIVVPRGVEHRPVADEEAEVLLFEPASTLNTGNVRDAFTVSQPKRL
jgi:mannose-6-phosphate isomerase-like protein (cupin superfamily)